MAFGSWIKKMAENIKTFAKNKILPLAVKGGEILRDKVGPALQTTGNIIGGSVGQTISNIGRTAGRVGNFMSDKDRVIRWTDGAIEHLKQPLRGTNTND